MFFANKWFRGLRGKLTAILATAGLTILALNLGAILGVRDIEYGIRSITEIRMPSIKGLEAMKEGQTAIMQTIGVIESSNDKTEVARMLQRFESKKKQIKEGRDLYDPLPQSPDEAEEYTNTFVKVWQNWQESCDAYIEAHKKNDIKLKQQLYTQTQVTFSPAEDSLAKIIAINYKNAEEDKGSAKAAAQRLLSVGTVLGIFASLFILIFGFYVSEKTANTLTVLANNINESTSQVSTAATQIASASQELSQATQEQASSLSQTTSSVEEMSSMIAKNSESAQTSADTSQKSQRRAQDGRDAVDRMRQSMDAINLSNEAIMTQVNQSNHEMAEIVKVIQEIGTKTKVINDIVFQTKLLSFNASVEAARVGELGKGFAVVAEEVGNLAQMSGNAAREISEMLDSSTAKVERIVSDTKTKVESLIIDGRHKVSTGLEVARQCGDALKAIVDDISQVSEMASQISSANQEQSQGISEINRAMSQLDTVTQQNAATSEQAASAAEELANQSHNLKCAVQELHQTINGRTSHATEDASRSVKVDYLRNRKPSEGKQKTVTVSHSNSTSSQAIVTKNTIAKESNQRTSQNPPTVGNDSIPNRDHDGFIEI